ncbi:MAG TPA: tryptophan 7-halogenase [Pyrinomonadaceae bacterium]|nr:tryptophan 7-halogenase [Pyrinomonadaceae bacterium]
MNRLVVIGSSISGGLAACYLKLRFPDCEVVSIQKPNAKFPIVGESLTEFSTLLFHEIGLGSYLEEHHFHKYGLTFHFKEKIDDPNDYTYSTHEAMRIPPMPSKQINRFTLAIRLRERARELDVKIIDATVTDVSINESGLHRIEYTADGEEPAQIETRWIVDASGRNRFLAKKLDLRRTSKYQRSSFWFRLEDFDKGILRQMDQVKKPQHCFDSYYVTHHFFGQHNWIWAIPMRSDRADCDLISIGIVYRPDLYKSEVSSVETFLSQVGAEHPVVAKLVASGKIVDTNIFRNYFYETKQNYSRRGWFIIGDAGDTVDPLYSTGIAMTSIQIKQVAAMIEADRNGTLTEEFVSDLEKLYKTIRDSLQAEISTLYEVMADPFQAHLRMHCASAFYFYVLLPSWLCGYISDRVGAKVMLKMLQDGAGRFESLKALLPVASRRLGALPASKIENLYYRTVNWNLRGPSEEMIPRDFAKCSLFFARIRFYVLKKSGWHQWTRHVSLCLADLFRALLFGVVMRRQPIKESTLVKRMVGAL